MKEYEEAIRSDAKLAEAHNNLGTAYFAAGRFEEAAAAFRRACELDSRVWPGVLQPRARADQARATEGGQRYAERGDARLQLGRRGAFQCWPF